MFFKQNSAYVVRMSDWSPDVCSSDLLRAVHVVLVRAPDRARGDLRPDRLVLQSRDDFSSRRRHCPAGSTVGDRKRLVEGKSVSVRVESGGRPVIQKKKD